MIFSLLTLSALAGSSRTRLAPLLPEGALQAPDDGNPPPGGAAPPASIEELPWEERVRRLESQHAATAQENVKLQGELAAARRTIAALEAAEAKRKADAIEAFIAGVADEAVAGGTPIPEPELAVARQLLAAGNEQAGKLLAEALLGRARASAAVPPGAVAPGARAGELVRLGSQPRPVTRTQITEEQSNQDIDEVLAAAGTADRPKHLPGYQAKPAPSAR